MKQIRRLFAGLFVFLLVTILVPKNAYSEASAYNAIFVYNQGRYFAASDGQNDIRALRLAWGTDSSMWHYHLGVSSTSADKSGYNTLGNVPDSSKSDGENYGSGCGLYATAHAAQWLKQSAAASPISLVSDLISVSAAPWDATYAGNYNSYVCSYGNATSEDVRGTQNEEYMYNTLTSGGCIILNIPGHYILAVGATKANLTGTSKTWFHIVDSSCRSTMSRLKGDSAYNFDMSSTAGSMYYAGGEYWISYDSCIASSITCVWAYKPNGGSGSTGSEMTTGYERTIPDGNYIIACAGNLQYYLDIEGTDVPAKNETNVTVAELLGHEPPAYDVWTVTYTNDGFYSIKQFNANMELDVYGGSTTSNANVSVHESANNSAHRWAIQHNGVDGYTIQAKCSGFYLDIEGSTVEANANVRQHSRREGSNQTWVFIPYKPSQPIEDGRYVILTGMDNGYEIDIPGDTGDIDNCANVQIWNDGASSQYNAFDITKLDNGYYKLIHSASGKALDLYGGGTENGRNVSLYDHDTDDNDAHQWAIIPYGDKYLIISKWSGYALDVNGGEAVDGANIYQWPIHGRANQLWTFVKAEYTVKFDANGSLNAPDDQTKYYKAALTLSENQPARAGYNFLGWAASADGSGSLYQPGDLYKLDSDIVLYAQWEALLGEPDFTLPAAITAIDESAFEGIAASVVDIPDTCASIGKWAFRNCKNLTQIRIPENCAVGTDAFLGCADVTIFGKPGSPAEAYANAHDNCTFVAE